MPLFAMSDRVRGGHVRPAIPKAAPLVDTVFPTAADPLLFASHATSLPPINLPGSSQGRDKSAVQELFPMHVISVPALLRLDRLESYQTLVERTEKTLVLMSPALTGRVLFVSHVWAGLDHPDPSGDKLRVLQGSLRRWMLLGDDAMEEFDDNRAFADNPKELRRRHKRRQKRRRKAAKMEKKQGRACKLVPSPAAKKLLRQPIETAYSLQLDGTACAEPLLTRGALGAALPHCFVFIDYCCIPQARGGFVPSHEPKPGVLSTQEEVRVCLAEARLALVREAKAGANAYMPGGGGGGGEGGDGTGGKDAGGKETAGQAAGEETKEQQTYVNGGLLSKLN